MGKEFDMSLAEFVKFVRESGAGYGHVAAKDAGGKALYAVIVVDGEFADEALGIIEKAYDKHTEENDR